MPPMMIGKLPPNGVDAPHDLYGPLGERCAAQAAAADLVERHMARMQPSRRCRWPRCRRAAFRQDVADFVDDFVRHVGRHLSMIGRYWFARGEVEQRIEYLEYVRARMVPSRQELSHLMFTVK